MHCFGICFVAQQIITVQQKNVHQFISKSWKISVNLDLIQNVQPPTLMAYCNVFRRRLVYVLQRQAEKEIQPEPQAGGLQSSGFQMTKKG